MSNRNFKDPIQSRPVEVQSRPPEDLETREPQTVPAHRRCPICFGRCGGVGQCEGTYKKASSLTRRYYKCNHCGHTWTIDFTPEQVRDGVNEQ